MIGAMLVAVGLDAALVAAIAVLALDELPRLRRPRWLYRARHRAG